MSLCICLLDCLALQLRFSAQFEALGWRVDCVVESEPRQLQHQPLGWVDVFGPEGAFRLCSLHVLAL